MCMLTFLSCVLKHIRRLQLTINNKLYTNINMGFQLWRWLTHHCIWNKIGNSWLHLTTRDYRRKYRDPTKASIYHDNTLTAGQRLKLTTIQLHMTSVVEIDMDSSHWLQNNLRASNLNQRLLSIIDLRCRRCSTGNSSFIKSVKMILTFLPTATH